MVEIRKLVPWNWFRHEGDDLMGGPRLARLSGRGGRSGLGGSVLALQRDLDRVFDRALRGMWSDDIVSPMFELGTGMEQNLRPDMDIAATDEAYSITVEVPGVEEKDVSLELGKDGTLVISGEKRQEQESEAHGVYRVERSYGCFRRMLSLPEDVDHTAITATFKNGVLTINIPRKAVEKAEVKRIDINVSQAKAA